MKARSVHDLDGGAPLAENVARIVSGRVAELRSFVPAAFDPADLGWLTAADAETTGAIRVPGLDGELVVDEASRTEAADDYGHIVHRKPVAVLRPGSVRDIATVVKFANKHGLKVATRGQGHSTFGQAQAGGGVVLTQTAADADADHDEEPVAGGLAEGVIDELEVVQVDHEN